MLAKINFWFCIFTWVTLFGTEYFFSCNFSDGNFNCKLGDNFEDLIGFITLIAIYSAMFRMSTLFLLDFCAFYYLILCFEGKNKKVKKNEKTI